MNALLWKDVRLNSGVLVVAVLLLLGPYLALAVWQVYEDWPALPERTAWARLLFLAGFMSLQASQLTLALLGGNCIACERADRSAEFLAALPISRARILASKLLLALLTVGVILTINLSLAHLVAPALTDKPLNIWEIPAHWWHLLGGVVIFGTAWLGSSFLESPTYAIVSGIVAPFAILGGLTTANLFFGWRPAQDDFMPWYIASCCLVGVLCFAAGTWYYLRRIEP